MFDLSGKVALITGSAKGIGLESAAALARSGATVYATDLDDGPLMDEIKTLQSEGLNISGHRLDVTSEEQWQQTVAEIEKTCGRLDTLVNNAGFMHCGHFLETTVDDYRKSMTVNFESIVMGMQTALPLMRKTSEGQLVGGSIINMSSVFAHVAGDLSSAYCASKAAATMLSKAAALDLSRIGANVRINTIHPGAVDTNLSRGFHVKMVDKGAFDSKETGNELVTQATPLARWGQVDDISGVVVFLASDASKFMTGAEINVDGGLTMT